MDVRERLNSINLTEVEKSVREIVIEVLDEILENGHDLGGMGEYGTGWNDRGVQVKMIVREMRERWAG